MAEPLTMQRKQSCSAMVGAVNTYQQLADSQKHKRRVAARSGAILEAVAYLGMPPSYWLKLVCYDDFHQQTSLLLR
jgi:hypothetical protein